MHTDQAWREKSPPMTNEIGEKMAPEIFADSQGFEKVRLQSQVFYFADEPGEGKEGNKNDALLASLMKSKRTYY